MFFSRLKILRQLNRRKVSSMKKLLLPPFVWFASAMTMILLHLTIPIDTWLPQPYSFLGSGAIVIGLGIASWHSRLFRRLSTNIDTFGTPGQLTTEGLFSRTRNPMYLGLLTALVGFACVLGTISPLVGPAVFFVLAQYVYIPFEERAMSLKFGDKYVAYQRSVSRWL